MAAVEQTKAVKAIGNSVEDEAISDGGEGRDGRADGECEKARRGSRQACPRRLEE